MTVALIVETPQDEQILMDLCAHLSAQKIVTTWADLDAQTHSHVVAVASIASREKLSILGAEMDVQPLTDVTAILDDDTYERPIYAGSAIETLRSNEPTKLISIRTGVAAKHTMSSDLAKASVVVGGGRAFGADGFTLVHDLADVLHGAVGATRAAVDAGYIANEAQIGQTGKSIAPMLYIACAIAGAAQHVGGIRGAKTVIAINTDPNAAIFKHATYGFVGDVFDVLPVLINRLKS